MNAMALFQDLSDESSKILRQFIDSNPVGSIILNEQLEVITINDSLINYFKQDINETEKFFGNIFNCQYLVESSDKCGTKRQCGNCKIRNSVKNALEHKRVIKKLQINKGFIINGELITKWFDMTIVPIDIKGKDFIWISLIDLTELMKYKVEYEFNQILTDEENLIEKDKFHNEVMHCIRTNCYKGGEAYLTLFELKHVQEIKDSFGSLWKNDYIASFYHFLKGQIDSSDYICRYTSDQFLLFLPYKGELGLKRLIHKVNEYQYKQFNINNEVKNKTIKFKMDSDYVKRLEAEDQLYIEYFKAISVLEKLDEDIVLEILIK